MATETFWTTAPEAYDGFSTQTVETAGTDKHGHTVRVVTIDSADVDWQTGRYQSGLYGAYVQRDAEAMFDCGLWTPIDDLEVSTEDFIKTFPGIFPPEEEKRLLATERRN